MLTRQFGTFGLTKEHVCIATLDHKTKFHLLPTSNYTPIRETLGTGVVVQPYCEECNKESEKDPGCCMTLF
ncbi:hypothetical protein DPMN_108921 [Dreissena polymorpha]|uniref:Uncharacterized protein n=1 Tax=Dreissena polymorpha TaxID=45954 RepID=A0A9D4K9C9_DREPO|nr:hypothetical protein DPMN_108921 [Dreissena polymorpha]